MTSQRARIRIAWALAILLASVSMLIVLSMFVTFAFGPDCGTQVEPAVVSPDGWYAARLVERSCGATTAFVTHVTIADRRARPGFLFARSADVFVYRGLPAAASLRWMGSQDLLVEYRDCRVVYIQDSRWQDLRVAYRADCQPSRAIHRSQ